MLKETMSLGWQIK